MSACKGAFDRSKEFALYQLTGQSGAVDFYDPGFAARAHGVNEIRDDLFAGAAFASNENGNIAGRHAFDGAHDRLHGMALENRGGSAAHRGKGAAQSAVLFALFFMLES